MDVLLTGGTGWIGSRVLVALLEAGHDVAALARSEDSAAALERAGATVVRGSVQDADVLRSAAARADAAIHTASPGDDTSADADRAASTAIQTGLAGRPYVHTGGIWVYGTTDGEVGEDAPFAPPSLTSWRVDVEAEVLARGGARIVMPGVVWGRQPGLLEDALGPDEQGRGRYPEGDPRTTAVHVDDVAALYVLALGAPDGTRLLGVAECVRSSAVARALSPRGEARPESAGDLEARLGPLAEAVSLDQQLSHARASALGWQPQHPDVVAEIAVSAT